MTDHPPELVDQIAVSAREMFDAYSLSVAYQDPIQLAIAAIDAVRAYDRRHALVSDEECWAVFREAYQQASSDEALWTNQARLAFAFEALMGAVRERLAGHAAGEVVMPEWVDTLTLQRNVFSNGWEASLESSSLLRGDDEHREGTGPTLAAALRAALTPGTDGGET